MLRSTRFLPYHLVFGFCLSMIVFSGFFDYAYYVPSADRIQSASITPVTGIPFIDDFSFYLNSSGTKYEEISPIPSYRSMDYYYYPDDYGYASSSANQMFLLADGFTTQEQIQAIVQWHKSYVNGYPLTQSQLPSYYMDSHLNNTGVTVLYRLKNGRFFYRYYDNISYDYLAELADIQQRFLWADLLLKILAPCNQKAAHAFSSVEYPYPLEHVHNDLFHEDWGIRLLIPHTSQNYPVLSMTASQRAELLEALRKDISQMQEKRQALTSEKSGYGFIQFCSPYDPSFLEPYSSNEENPYEDKYSTGLHQNSPVLPLWIELSNTMQFLEKNGFYEFNADLF